MPEQQGRELFMFSDEPAEWDVEWVATRLCNEREIEPDSARKIAGEVEREIKARAPDVVTHRIIGEVAIQKMVEHGFIKEIPLSPAALKVLHKRYLRKDHTGAVVESPHAMFQRVARSIAEADRRYGAGEAEVRETERRFYEGMTSLRFLPNSPTLMNAGRELGQLSACFVLPVEDSMTSIFEAIKDTALIHKSGGGTGFSFSRIRPHNDVVHSTKGISSGPISFMKVFDATTETIKQGGTRRGANMAILNVDHPDVLDFITCKSDNARLNNFNISVGLTEAFMEAVHQDRDYDLINPRTGQKQGKLSARKVFDLITTMAWKNGEPGIVFIDRLNKHNPTPKLGRIESTNPCGEQPLLPYESCNLGSINLAHMARNGAIDWDLLRRTVHDAVHFLDNVIDVNRYPIEAIGERTRQTRKIGLGVMGFADMLIRLGVPYDSERGLQTATEVMAFVDAESKAMSARLAESRGPFPAFEGSIWDRPASLPLRNATTTTIAPTGTISMIAGASSGMEPVFALCYTRQNILDGDSFIETHPLFERTLIERYGEQRGRELIRNVAATGSAAEIDEIDQSIRSVFVTAHDITPEWHIRMQAAFQQHTDNAVSKTVNFPKEATREEIEQVYLLAYRLGCKGVTVYRSGSREHQVLAAGQTAAAPAETPAAVEPESRPRQTIRDRPEMVRGVTQKIVTGCGNLYVTINEDEQGPVELFTTMGKAGGCPASQAEATSRMISMVFRAGIEPEVVMKQLAGVRCPKSIWFKGEQVLSCADAIAKAIRRYIDTRPAAAEGEESGPGEDVAQRVAEIRPARREPALSSGAATAETCPDCGASGLVMDSGCMYCRECAYSKCD